MDHRPIKMDERPLDLAEHGGETLWGVWKRRLLFLLLIGLCVAFAAPTFGSCSGAFGRGVGRAWGSFRVGGETIHVTDQDFQRAARRLGAVYRIVNPQARDIRLTDDRVWAMLMLDAAAKAEGIHVADEQITRTLGELPDFQTDGKFDPAKYAAEVEALRRHSDIDHDGITWALKMLLRIQTYTGVYESAFNVPESRAAYDEWKKQNVKVTIDYVVQPFEPLEEEARKLPVTEDDLRRAMVLPEAVKMRTIPALRGFEAAFVRVRDVTAAQQAAMEAYAASASLWPEGETLESVAWNLFWGNHKPGAVFSRENWLALKRPAYEEALKAWEATPEPRGEKPKDPATEPWPPKPADQFGQRWREWVSREVLARDVLGDMARRAQRESKSFADLLPDYEKFGVRVVTTPEPLGDDDLVEKFPEGLGKDSDLEQTVRTQFRPPEAGVAFVPRVAAEPFPTTRVVPRILDRGWAVLRWSSHVPAREKSLDEIREPLTAYYREYRTRDISRDLLTALRKQVAELGGDVAAKQANLAKLATEKGLAVDTIRRFNRQTRAPTPPTLGPDATAVEKAGAERVKQRVRMLSDYDFLSKQEAGTLRDPVIVDEPTEAAYLSLVVEKHEPLPIEMDEGSLYFARRMQVMRANEALQGLLSFDALKTKFSLELVPEAAKSAEEKKDDGG